MQEKNKEDKLENEIKNMQTEDLIKLLVEKMGYEFSKEKIKDKPSTNYQEKKEEIYTEYLKGFDEQFDTHTKQRINETPLLINLFQEFVQEIYKPSSLYEMAQQLKFKISDELDKSLNKKQKKLLEQWKFCEDRLLDDMIEQAFIYGYSMASQLREEAIKQYPYKEDI